MQKQNQQVGVLPNQHNIMVLCGFQCGMNNTTVSISRSMDGMKTIVDKMAAQKTDETVFVVRVSQEAFFGYRKHGFTIKDENACYFSFLFVSEMSNVLC